MYQLNLSKAEFEALQDLLAKDICKRLCKDTKVYERILNKFKKCKPGKVVPKWLSTWFFTSQK